MSIDGAARGLDAVARMVATIHDPDGRIRGAAGTYIKAHGFALEALDEAGVLDEAAEIASAAWKLRLARRLRARAAEQRRRMRKWEARSASAWAYLVAKQLSPGALAEIAAAARPGLHLAGGGA